MFLRFLKRLYQRALWVCILDAHAMLLQRLGALTIRCAVLEVVSEEIDDQGALVIKTAVCQVRAAANEIRREIEQWYAAAKTEPHTEEQLDQSAVFKERIGNCMRALSEATRAARVSDDMEIRAALERALEQV